MMSPRAVKISESSYSVARGAVTTGVRVRPGASTAPSGVLIRLIITRFAGLSHEPAAPDIASATAENGTPWWAWPARTICLTWPSSSRAVMPPDSRVRRATTLAK